METQHFMNAPGKVLAEPLNFYVEISQITTYEIVEDFHHFTYAVKMDTKAVVRRSCKTNPKRKHLDKFFRINVVLDAHTILLNYYYCITQITSLTTRHIIFRHFFSSFKPNSFSQLSTTSPHKLLMGAFNRALITE